MGSSPAVLLLLSHFTPTSFIILALILTHSFLQVREYADPSCDALLPELAPELRGRVKTLVLDLEGLLVHKEWSRAKGWQVRVCSACRKCQVLVLLSRSACSSDSCRQTVVWRSGWGCSLCLL